MTSDNIYLKERYVKISKNLARWCKSENNFVGSNVYGNTLELARMSKHFATLLVMLSWMSYIIILIVQQNYFQIYINLNF